jgi:hypothetical protein
MIQDAPAPVAAASTPEKTSFASRLLAIPLSGILLVIMTITVISAFRHAANPHITIRWKTPDNVFTSQEQDRIYTALRAALDKPNPRADNVLYVIVNAQRQGPWGIFGVEEYSGSQRAALPAAPLFFIAHQHTDAWSVFLTGDDAFCLNLAQLPPKLLADEDKRYFLGCKL